MHLRILLILLLCCLTTIPIAAEEGGDFTLYLVRHAEKQSDGTRDPALTKAGRQRAQQLADWLQDKGIQDVWSSDYKRTRNTAAPLLSGPGLELSLYDPGKLTALSENLITRRNTALVVGHSNTTPELARSLCQCSIADMDESEYDRLIVISVNGKKVQARTLNQGDLFKPKTR